MWGEGHYLLRPGWDFCAKTQFLGVVSHFCASVSFRQLPSASVALFLVGFAPRGIIHVEEGNYLLRHGWDFCAKTQFLGVVIHFVIPSASVSFRSSLPCRIRSTRNHPCGGGELFIEAWVGFLRENAISSCT